MNIEKIYNAKGKYLGEARLKTTSDKAKNGNWYIAYFAKDLWVLKGKSNTPYLGKNDYFLVHCVNGQFIVHQTVAVMEKN